MSENISLYDMDGKQIVIGSGNNDDLQKFLTKHIACKLEGRFSRIGKYSVNNLEFGFDGITYTVQEHDNNPDNFDYLLCFECGEGFDISAE